MAFSTHRGWHASVQRGGDDADDGDFCWGAHEEDDVPGGQGEQCARSVSKIVGSGNKVIFDPEGSYIENVWNNDRIWLREDNGVYVLDMMVAPP